MRLCSALVITHLVCAAATLDAQQVLVGTALGTTSSIQHRGVTDYRPLQGMTAGLKMTLEVNSWIALQGEASYVRKGDRIDDWYEMSVGYLEAPLLVRVGSPLGSSTIRPFLTAGVAPAEEIGCSGYEQRFFPLGVLARSDIPPGTTSLDCDSQRKRHADIGSVIGGGFSFDRGPLQFTAEARRTRGRNISSYSGCCELRNDVTSFVIGASRRVH